MTVALRSEVMRRPPVAAAADLADELGVVLSSLAVDDLPTIEAGALVEVLSRLANLVDVGRARCARRAAEGHQPLSHPRSILSSDELG